jgi:hypothetical protein
LAILLQELRHGSYASVNKKEGVLAGTDSNNSFFLAQAIADALEVVTVADIIR